MRSILIIIIIMSFFLCVNAEVSTVNGISINDISYINSISSLDISSVNGEEYEYGFDLSLFSFSSDSLSLTYIGSPDPYSFCFGDSESKMYILDSQKKIYQYSVGDINDMSTFLYSSISYEFSETSAASPISIQFNNAGDKLYVLFYSGLRIIEQYSLGTSWDISTISRDNKIFAVNSETTTPTSINIAFNNNKIFIADISGDIFQYSISDTTDISTMLYDSKSITVPLTGQLWGGGWTNTKNNICYTVGSYCTQYLSEDRNDLSKFKYQNNDIDLGSTDSSPRQICISSDSENLYILGGTNNRIYRYSK